MYLLGHLHSHHSFGRRDGLLVEARSDNLSLGNPCPRSDLRWVSWNWRVNAYLIRRCLVVIIFAITHLRIFSWLATVSFNNKEFFYVPQSAEVEFAVRWPLLVWFSCFRYLIIPSRTIEWVTINRQWLEKSQLTSFFQTVFHRKDRASRVSFSLLSQFLTFSSKKHSGGKSHGSLRKTKSMIFNFFWKLIFLK